MFRRALTRPHFREHPKSMNRLPIRYGQNKYPCRLARVIHTHYLAIWNDQVIRSQRSSCGAGFDHLVNGPLLYRFHALGYTRLFPGSGSIEQPVAPLSPRTCRIPPPSPVTLPLDLHVPCPFQTLGQAIHSVAVPGAVYCHLTNPARQPVVVLEEDTCGLSGIAERKNACLVAGLQFTAAHAARGAAVPLPGRWHGA